MFGFCMRSGLKRKVFTDLHELLTSQRIADLIHFLLFTDVTHEKDEGSACQGQTS